LSQEASVSPGFSPERMCALMRSSVDLTGLDLRGMTILTEAATGAYGVTAPLAALAGARRVLAVGRASSYGSAAQAAEWTLKLAYLCGVADRVSVVDAVPDSCQAIDIVTNSGHLRPLDANLISKLPTRSVIALMFEAWEFRESDIDLGACKARGIPIVGVNERHPSVDVFSYLGPLCVKLIHDAGLPIYGNRIAVLCDNAFNPYITRALEGLGGLVTSFEGASALTSEAWDCVVVALEPRSKPRLDRENAKQLARVAPGAVVAQFWGDIDRDALSLERIPVWPRRAPKTGHMAVLLSALGPEPVIRLQAGGLRAAEWVYRQCAITSTGIAQLV
jgi:hypothetical protein